MAQIAKSPISYPIDVRRLPQKGFPVVVEPDAKARAELARVHGLVSVERFRAELLFVAWKRGGVSVTGSVRATIVQQCVVTLEPIEAQIDEEVDLVFVPEGSALARDTIEEGELVLSADGPDLPETFDGVSIDAGGTAEEVFALAIDPYPRKPDAELPSTGPDDGEGSPFATLRGLVPKI
ncbi:MAG: DUF177 domain-containing protein [Pseudomonadota bacterium]